MTSLLSPKVDFVFKKIFGNEKQPEILISFLNSILKYDDPIKTVEIKNTDIEKEFSDAKFSRLDVKAKTDKGELINIEIQIKNEHNMKERSLYYWSKIFSEQMLTGENYSTLAKTICINILDFNYLDCKDFHSCWEIKNSKTNEVLTDKLQLHFIELRKFMKCNTEEDLDLWIEFINEPQGIIIEDAAENNIPIKEAKKELTRISSDDADRERYAKRQKILRDEANIVSNAKLEGIEEGKLETIKSFLDVLDDETISLKTNVNIKTIHSLRDSQNS